MVTSNQILPPKKEEPCAPVGSASASKEGRKNTNLSKLHTIEQTAVYLEQTKLTNSLRQLPNFINIFRL
jgi:hypothetical protein